MFSLVRCLRGLVVLLLLSACGVPATPSNSATADTPLNWTYAATWEDEVVRSPAGIAIDSQGLVYIADMANQRVYVFQPDGTALTSWGTQNSGSRPAPGMLAAPQGIAIDDQDYVYVVNAGRGRIAKFTRDGQLLSAWGTFGSGPGEFTPTLHGGRAGIAVDGEGRIYVADIAAGQIQTYSPDGAFITEWQTAPNAEGRAFPAALAVHGDRLYVADPLQSQIQVYTRDGRLISTWGDRGPDPGQFQNVGGLAVGDNGAVYVADEDRVQIFTPAGAYQATIGGEAESHLTAPSEIALDSAGRLYALDVFDIDTYVPAGVPAIVRATPVLPAAVLPGTPAPAGSHPPAALTPANIASLTAAATLGKGSLHRVALSADGRQIALATSTGVQLYDGQTLAARYSIAIPQGVDDLMFSPSGAWLALAMDDGAIFIINPADGRQYALLRDPAVYEHYGASSAAIAFSPDETLLASATVHTVNLWQLADGSLLRTMSGHKDFISALSFSADGTTLLSIDTGMSAAEPADSEPLEARLWDVHSGALRRAFVTTAFDVGNIVVAPGAETFVTTDDSHHMAIWRVTPDDLTRGEPLPSSADWPALAFSSDGRTFALGREDGVVSLHASHDGALLKDVPGSGAPINSLALSADGGEIIASTTAGMWRWSIQSGAMTGEIGGFGAGISAIAISPDSTRLLAGTSRGQLLLWDLATRTLLWSVQGHSSDIMSLAFAPDGKTIASGSPFEHGRDHVATEMLRLWSADSGQLIASAELPPERLAEVQLHGIVDLAFSPDGTRLASATTESLVVWQVDGGQLVKKRSMDEVFSQIEFTPDGQFLAALVRDANRYETRICLWAMNSSACELPVHLDLGGISNMAPSGDGTNLLISSGITLNTVTPADGALHTIVTATDQIDQMALAPDGQLMALSLDNGQIEVWDLAAGTLLHTYRAHSRPASGLAFTPDGATLITASGNGTIILWQAP
jgi:WD40 repeat protein/sugar lactone lactonase YvrE